MELKKSFDYRKIFIFVYALAFLVYIIVGLQPADASSQYKITGKLIIPSIELESDVAELELLNNKLDTPDTIVGSYSNSDNNTLLIAHSTSAFIDLDRLNIGNLVIYNDNKYLVTDVSVFAKKDIQMRTVLQEESVGTIKLMTCFGELYEGGDASHRLIVTAKIL